MGKEVFTDLKESKITVSCTEREKADIAAAAKAKRMSISSYVILAAIEKMDAEAGR